MTGRILSLGLAADLLGVSAGTFRRNRPAWEKLGFPKPLKLNPIGRGKRLRYDAEAIEAWLQRQRPRALRTVELPAAGPTAEDPIAHARLQHWLAAQEA